MRWLQSSGVVRRQCGETDADRWYGQAALSHGRGRGLRRATFTPPMSDLPPMAELADLSARERLSSLVMKQIRLFSALL